MFRACLHALLFVAVATPGSLYSQEQPRWRIALVLGAETALNAHGFDLNQFDTRGRGLDIDELRGRHRLRAELEISRRLSRDFGLLVGIELISMHGKYLPLREESWGFERVARVFVYRYGFLLPGGFHAYMESQAHWKFADFPDDVIDGPFEIYNMIMIGRDLSWDLGRERRWTVSGRCELGVNFERNEYGLNLRRPGEAETGGFGDNFGRYAVRCRELALGRRLEAGPFLEVELYANVFLALGRTIPQRVYTWSPRYIGHQRNLGLRVRLPDDWSLSLERQWSWYFADQEAVSGLGPFGAYVSLGVTKDFEWRF